ncbi:hypothetical protein ABC195_04960 [Microbacterium sp. 2P01SA-2]|uniref:hypothetical protein n=1 Tax=unclassified Microbacterium TaxID=2609290 RepID=UPI0039A31234
MIWADLLDGLEAELTGDPAGDLPWHPPAGLGPLPEHLEDRARTILRAQTSRARQLRTELDTLRGHLGALDRIPQSLPEAVYLDIDG